MKKFLLSVVLLGTIMLTAQAQAQKLRTAFIDMKEKEFRKTFLKLAMLPVVAAPAAALPDKMKQRITAEVLEYLDDEDFDVVGPQVVSVIQSQFEGLYPNPMAEQSQVAIEEHTRREIFFQHPVDGLVLVQVLAVAAPFRDDKAEWGGTSQKIESSGDGFFGSIMGKDYGGHIAASSIRITITDRSGKPGYYWAGGVELMMRRNGDKLEPLPNEELWQSDKRVRRAVKYAFKPF